MALRQDESRRRVVAERPFSYRFCPLEKLYSATLQETEDYMYDAAHGMQFVSSAVSTLMLKTLQRFPTKLLPS